MLPSGLLNRFYGFYSFSRSQYFSSTTTLVVEGKLACYGFRFFELPKCSLTDRSRGYPVILG